MIEDFVAAIRITANAIGSIIPFAAPANTRSFTGFGLLIKIIVDIIINKLITIFSFFAIAGCKVFQNETDVKMHPQLK